MKKIKTYLIHLLGGYTGKDVVIHVVKSEDMGKLMALRSIKAYADRINGVDADVWCKEIYNRICHEMNTVKKDFNKWL